MGRHLHVGFHRFVESFPHAPIILAVSIRFQTFRPVNVSPSFQYGKGILDLSFLAKKLSCDGVGDKRRLMQGFVVGTLGLHANLSISETSMFAQSASETAIECY